MPQVAKSNSSSFISIKGKGPSLI